MKVPFFGLDRQYQRYKEEYMGIANRVWSSGKVLQGPDVSKLEEMTRGICGREHGVAVGSCTDALAFALEVNGIGEGDEVLVTAFSFFASVSPIVRVGARPVFVDIDANYYMMDLSKADALVGPKTKAIMAVHLFGQTLPMEAVETFAKRHNLIIIEDTAQALGSYDGERPAGCLGSASCVSFDPTKVIGSFSSAGLFLTDDEKMAERVRMLRYHGRSLTGKDFEMLGYNSQLASEMAAMLCFKLTKLNQWQDERTAIATGYLQHLADVDEVILPKIRPGSTANWHKFVLQARERDGLMKFLKDQGVESMIHYPKALCDEPCIKALGLAPEAVDVPVTRSAANSVISLPIYPDLTQAEVRFVADRIKQFYVQH